MTSAESKFFSTVLQTSLLLCSSTGNCIFFHFQMAVFIAKVAVVPNTHRLFLFFPPLLNKGNFEYLTSEFRFYLTCVCTVIPQLYLEERGNCKNMIETHFFPVHFHPESLSLSLFLRHSEEMYLHHHTLAACFDPIVRHEETLSECSSVCPACVPLCHCQTRSLDRASEVWIVYAE